MTIADASRARCEFEENADAEQDDANARYAIE
jgi:hypothetical protein